jgi:negative regulator of genetic competence, sporulation and motility
MVGYTSSVLPHRALEPKALFHQEANSVQNGTHPSLAMDYSIIFEDLESVIGFETRLRRIKCDGECVSTNNKFHSKPINFGGHSNFDARLISQQTINFSEHTNFSKHKWQSL